MDNHPFVDASHFNDNGIGVCVLGEQEMNLPAWEEYLQLQHELQQETEMLQEIHNALVEAGLL
jgi:hypothetical protein